MHVRIHLAYASRGKRSLKKKNTTGEKYLLIVLNTGEMQVNYIEADT